ncbi:MAG: hypothetical protein RR589_11145 [Hafnia sp.]|uniref:hypothetical protein n=1 Tax=Hafnia sp. TaxID=1873498 RepID=UPI002FC8BA4B
MTKLTTERLEEIAKLEITEFSNGMDIAKDAYQSVGSSEIVLMARQLLAYEQAAEHSAARITWDGSEFSVSNVSEDFLYGGTAVYLAPVLPKQPELIGMKVSIDTGSDNIGHRLFGEIVGTSDSNGVPVLCIEVAENNGDMAAPAQPVIPDNDDDDLIQRISGRAKFLRDKGEIKTPVLIEAAISALSAQPVSEPYKLISVKDDTPTESGDYWCYLGKDFESPTKYRVVHFDVRHHEFQDHRVTHWMRLPAEPEREA